MIESYMKLLIVARGKLYYVPTKLNQMSKQIINMAKCIICIIQVKVKVKVRVYSLNKIWKRRRRVWNRTVPLMRSRWSLKNASLTKITLCVKYIFRNNTKVRTNFKYMIGKYYYYGRATIHQIQYFREWIAKAMLNWVYQRNDSSCMTLNLKLTDS